MCLVTEAGTDDDFACLRLYRRQSQAQSLTASCWHVSSGVALSTTLQTVDFAVRRARFRLDTLCNAYRVSVADAASTVMNGRDAAPASSEAETLEVRVCARARCEATATSCRVQGFDLD